MGFGEVERAQLRAVCDTIFASLGQEDTSWIQNGHLDKPDLEAFCNRSASSYGVPEAVEEYLFKHAPEDAVTELGLLLRAFGSPALMILLNGRWSAFDALSVDERENSLKEFKGSIWEAKRKAFYALKGAISLMAFTILGDNDSNKNPNWSALGYDGPDISPKSVTEEYMYTMINSTVIKDCTLEYDVVVVGSGCGGSVVAAELSAAGAKVLVIEKSTYYTRADMSGDEGEGFDRYYERGGILATEDSGISVLAGSAFGGGSAVNWACCLETPWYVRKEWASEHHLKSFVLPSFQASIDAVKQRLGVTTAGIVHNGCNKLLLAGCTELGHTIKVAGQNMAMVGEDSPGSGFISAGDRSGIKQAAPQTFLKDAAESGTHFADRTYVSKVLHDGKGRVSGVETKMVSANGKEHKVIVNAKTVVVSCGSLHTPALLMRSEIPKLNQSGQLGKNLRLHPVSTTVAIMPEAVRIWDGAPMTTVCDSVAAGPVGDFYGAKLECPSTHPGMLSVGMPWHGRREFKDLMLNADRCHVTIVLCRDKGSGEVRLVNGEPRLYYPLASHDAKSMVDGLVEAVRISAASGAETIGTAQSVVENNPRTLPPVNQRQDRAAAVEDFIRDIRKAGIATDFRTAIFSAHQMGTCKMSASPNKGVVQETGEAWACKGLYVADASIFPTSSGANPMITTYACAHTIAQHIKCDTLQSSHVRSNL